MTQIPDYERGYRDGLRAAATFCQQEAKAMNDPRAVSFWNSVAFQLGCLIRDRKVNFRRRDAAKLTVQSGYVDSDGRLHQTDVKVIDAPIDTMDKLMGGFFRKRV